MSSDNVLDETLWVYRLSCGHMQESPSVKPFPDGTTTWCELDRKAVGMKLVQIDEDDDGS